MQSDRPFVIKKGLVENGTDGNARIPACSIIYAVKSERLD